jgi:DNA-binding XRE family transcriptional regulator
MFKRIKINRRQDYRMTTLELAGPENELQVRFISNLSKQERRAFLRGFLGEIRPWLHYFQTAAIDHSADGSIRDRRNQKRGVSLFQKALKQEDVLNPVTVAIGYEIKMQRLELGVTQKRFAATAGFRQSHLSDIERGIYSPNANTRKKIATAFEIFATIGKYPIKPEDPNV